MNMNKIDKWWSKNKDRLLPGLLVIVFVTWLGTKLLDWLAGQLSSKLNLLSKILKYRINIPFFAFLISLIAAWTCWNLYKKIKIGKRKLRIINAVYGADGKYFDITYELNLKVIDEHLKIVIDNNIAGDPNPGVFKNGKVNYKFNGKDHEVQFKEGELLVIP